jgi:predicted peroxiredoxin
VTTAPGDGSRADLLVESRGPWAGPGCARFLADAAALAAAGRGVRLLLVADAVTAAVAPGQAVRAPLDSGVEVWVDDHALRRRSLCSDDLASGVQVRSMAAVAQAVLAPGVRVVWR